MLRKSLKTHWFKEVATQEIGNSARAENEKVNRVKF